MKGCARLFKFQVLDGQETAYAAYLETVVTAIDRVAHKSDVFIDLITIRPQAADSAWNHGRLFTFRDHAQRAAFAGGVAEAALAFDGSEAAREARKATAETMRRLVAVADYDLF
jgi:hypothetical protein